MQHEKDLRSFSATPPKIIKRSQADDVPPIERSLTCQPRIISTTESALDWILKVLGVASAILFGIWAPVSYRLQNVGNKSSDDAQAQFMQKMERMRREIEELKGNMNSLAVLRAWEFCADEERTVSALSLIQCLQSVSGTAWLTRKI